MVVDFHTHIFPDKIAGKTIEALEKKSGTKAVANGSLDGLERSMEDAGVDISVVLPVVTRPEQFKTINEFAYRLNESYDQAATAKLVSFGGIHPDSTDYRQELKDIVSMGFKGIKLHPDYQRTMFDDIKYMNIVDYASELGLIISVHAGVDVGYPDPVHTTPVSVQNVIREVRPDRLVLAHYGGFQLWNEVEDILAGENVYLDTAYIANVISNEQFMRILNRHGSDKILFATDSPWSGQKESLQWIKQTGIVQEDLDKVLYKNALELLNM